MKFYDVQPERYSLSVTDARKWGLPGVQCPGCKEISAVGSLAFPCVDLSRLPDLANLEEVRVEDDFEKFVQLRERVRPFIPKGAPLLPGTGFGPLVGSARGTFGSLSFAFPWLILARPEALAALEAEGIRGLKGCPTQLQLRRNAPEGLMELQIEPHGRLHRDCLPPDKTTPCVDCGRLAIAMPDPLLLDLSSMPTDRDIFRLENLLQVIVVTEPFVDAVKRLGFKNLTFRELDRR